MATLKRRHGVEPEEPNKRHCGQDHQADPEIQYGRWPGGHDNSEITHSKIDLTMGSARSHLLSGVTQSQDDSSPVVAVSSAPSISNGAPLEDKVHVKSRPKQNAQTTSQAQFTQSSLPVCGPSNEHIQEDHVAGFQTPSATSSSKQIQGFDCAQNGSNRQDQTTSYGTVAVSIDGVASDMIANNTQDLPCPFSFESIPSAIVSRAFNWIKLADYQPNKTKVDKIPGIPKDYIKDFANEPIAYIPEDIWMLRHLGVWVRYQMYLEFQDLNDEIGLTPFSKQKFWDIWELLKKKTEKLQLAEQFWYRKYKERKFGEEEISKDGKKKALITWNRWLMWQSEPMHVDHKKGRCRRIPRHSPSHKDPLITSTGGKRRAGDSEDSDTEVSSKKSRHEDNVIDEVGLTEQRQKRPQPPLHFSTDARDQMLRHRQGKGVDESPAYKAEHKEAGTGACSKYAWMAEADEIEQMVQKQDAIQQNSVPPTRGFTEEENRKLVYWKQEWSGDKVSLPDHPFPNVDDYVPNEAGVYQCFHKDFACAEGTCSHGCCKNGYDTKGLKRAIAKAIRIYKSQVERKIEDGDLDRRHKFWPNWCNPRLKEKKIQGKTKTKNKTKERVHQATPEKTGDMLDAINTTTTEAQREGEHISEPDIQAVTAAAATLAAQRTAELEDKIKADMKMVDRGHREARRREKRKNYPNFDLLDAWWAAARKEYQGLTLNSEERALRDLPGGDPSLSDKKPVTKTVALTQSASEQPQEELQQEAHGFDPLFDNPLVVEPLTEESIQEDEGFDPLFDEPPIDAIDDASDPLLDDSELNEYII
ncbi:Nn.00g032810.m01.CDS01 [Neocucurbitaria sp. VM-36]